MRTSRDIARHRRALRAALLCASLPLMLSGCTRTYDGTVVPAYELVPAAGKAYGWYEMKPVDTLPPARLYRFPPPPPPAPPMLDAAAKAPAHRRAGRLIPKIDDQLPKAVSCRDETVNGRVRVVCL